jgi:hypothetical protein
MKYSLKSISSKRRLKIVTNAAGGAVIGTLIGFLLHLQHFSIPEPLEGSSFLDRKGEVAIWAMAGAVLLPSTLEASRWAARTYLAGLSAALRAKAAAHEHLLPRQYGHLRARRPAG